MEKSNTFVYTYSAEKEHEQFLYINLTNKCTNRCTFCIRNNDSGVGDGKHLWLEHEPEADEIKEALKAYDVRSYKEVIFCGYGEPTIRLDTLLTVAKYLKDTYGCTVRINTNGHANEYHKKDVTPLFEGLIDTVSVSLNASNAEEYDKCCRSVYGKRAFDIMLDFARCASKHTNVVLSVVDIIGEDEIEKCKKIASSVGAALRVREYIEN